MRRRWPRCGTAVNSTCGSRDAASLQCATLESSEALRARRIPWRAVADSPLPGARLPDGSCLVSGHTPPHGIATSATAELQELLLATEDITAFLDQLATLAVTVLPADTSCGITLRRDHGAMTVASSDTRASQVDEIQYGHDEGPCLHSLHTGEVVVVDDLAADDRWGAYQMPALGHGVRSSLSLPLRTNGQVLGALNIYATTPHVFGPQEQLAARRFADEASRVLALAVRIAERTEMSEHLQTALASRAVIDQALGIFMGQNGCTADEAFDVLRTISQNRNIKLRDIAAEMITAVSGRPPADNPRFS
jgi:putative methionine-R-sulfoxide reductase with GAF domain